MARIGLLSDSHGQARRTRHAVRWLLAQEVDLLLHLGDVETEAVVDALIEKVDAQGRPDPPVRLVFGNTDWQVAALQRYAQGLGITVDHPEGRLVIDGKTVMFTHGHREKAIHAALDEGVEYLCHGHTHLKCDERIGNTRVINPGALHRARPYTVAILDTTSDAMAFREVHDD